MLGEPPPSQGDIHFGLFGIPIRIHPLFWLITLVLGANSSGVPEVMMWIVAAFVAILIHELGHGLMVKAYGFHPWIVLYGMGGVTCHDPSERYSSKANMPLGQISISIAGPAAGFLLAAALVILLFAAGHRDEVQFARIFYVIPFPIWLKGTLIGELTNNIFFISVFWGLLNLLPIYPLDGGQISREIMLFLNIKDGIRLSLMLSIVTAVLIAAFGLIQLRSMLMAFFFAYMAYENFMMMQAYSHGGRP
jgi:stage IV sporulation protein FB